MAVYRVNDSVVFRNTERSLIMAFDKTRGVMYELNDTASSVLKLIDGKRSVDAVVQALEEEYETDGAEMRSDVEEILSRFVNVALVVPVEGP